jgi:hypothetical protein
MVNVALTGVFIAFVAIKCIAKINSITKIVKAKVTLKARWI